MVGVTLAQARYEFVESFRVTAVTVSGFWHSTRKPPLQRFNRPSTNFVLYLEDVFHLEVVFFRKGDFLRGAVVQLNRDTPACAQVLDVPL